MTHPYSLCMPHGLCCQMTKSSTQIQRIATDCSDRMCRRLLFFLLQACGFAVGGGGFPSVYIEGHPQLNALKPFALLMRANSIFCLQTVFHLTSYHAVSWRTAGRVCICDLVPAAYTSTLHQVPTIFQSKEPHQLSGQEVDFFSPITMLPTS